VTRNRALERAEQTTAEQGEQRPGSRLKVG
jgi:hypothetical protein